MNSYADEVYESEQNRTCNKRLGVTLDDKYERAYLKRVMGNQYSHLIKTQRNELIKLLKLF